MKAAFPRIDVRTIHQSEANRLGGGKAKSFILDGVVYINVDKVTPATVIHEFTGHFMSAALYDEQPGIWRKIVTTLGESKIGEQVRQKYPEHRGNDQFDEYFATWVGIESNKQKELIDSVTTDEWTWDSFKNWLKRFWNQIRSKFLRKSYGMDNLNLEGMTMDENGSNLD